MQLVSAESGHRRDEVNLKSGHLHSRTGLLWGGGASSPLDRGPSSGSGALIGFDFTDSDGNPPSVPDEGREMPDRVD